MTSVVIDRDDSEVGPVGFGGWLLVVGARLAIGLVMVSGRVMATSDHPGLQFVLSLLLGVQSLMVFFYLARRKEFVTAYVVINGGLLLMLGAFSLIDATPESIGGFFGMCLGELPFMAYVIRSKRVRNTFTSGE